MKVLLIFVPVLLYIHPIIHVIQFRPALFLSHRVDRMEGYPVNVLTNTSNVSQENPFFVSAQITQNTSNISAANPLPSQLVQDTSNVSFNNPLPVAFPPYQTDAFGRLRVSNPYTLFDHFHRYADDTKMVTYTSNTASSNFDINGGSMMLTVGSNAGDLIYRESARVFAYQPGKSLQILQTFSMSPPKTGLRQRIGYFDTSNGIYLQKDGSNVSMVLRSYVSGSVKETIAIQDSWNYDPMKGNGPSTHTIDLTRTQIFFMDIEWLGVGDVRTGFFINGKPCICHIFRNANQPSTATYDSTKPYMTTACLPVRIELENTAATGSTSSMRSICMTVISEGGYELRGRKYSIGITPVSSPIILPLADTLYSIIGIRLNPNRLGAIVLPTDISIVPTSSGTFRWAIVRNGTISSPTWSSINSDSSVQYTMDGGTVTGGVVMKSGYITVTNQVSSTIDLRGINFQFQLERDSFASTPYTFVVAVSSDGINDAILASIDWEEITV
jgi:hypothetical protein